MLAGTPVVLNGSLRIVHRMLFTDKKLLGAYEVWSPVAEWIEMAWARDLYLLSGKMAKEQDITDVVNWEKHLSDLVDPGLIVYGDYRAHFREVRRDIRRADDAVDFSHTLQRVLEAIHAYRYWLAKWKLVPR